MTRLANSCRLLTAALALAALGGCASENAAPVSAAANSCPAWTDFPTDSHSNDPSPYLGCNNALNLYHMVETKDDLHRGRDLGPADGERQVLAVTNYEEDKVKKSSGSAQVIFAPAMTTGSAGGQ